MSNYPEHMVAPMRQELVEAGFSQLMSPDEVDAALARPGRTLLVVNSVCGCAAAGARPGVRLALEKGLSVDQCLTVFAGMEKEATTRAREHFEGATPTSPQAALFQDGQLVALLQRPSFQDQTPEGIAQALLQAAKSFN